jgi:hypothetical protein
MNTIWRERERERRKLGGGVVRDTTVLVGVGSLEGSQAVPASPFGKGKACIGDLFNFDFKDVGAAVVGELWSKFGRAILWRKILKS